MLREHLEVIERSTGITPEQLIPLPFPYELSHIWSWFQQINRMRRNSGFGIGRLSDEIVTFQQLEGIRLNPYELDVIMQLDAVFVAHNSKSNGADDGADEG